MAARFVSHENRVTTQETTRRNQRDCHRPEKEAGIWRILYEPTLNVLRP